MSVNAPCRRGRSKSLLHFRRDEVILAIGRAIGRISLRFRNDNARR